MLLTHDDVSVEIILDGAHIDPRIVDITTRVKPKDKVIGVSNSIQFEPGQPNGYYEKDDRIFTADGILAGTAHSLDEGWMQLLTYSHLTNPLAAACFTLNPAMDLGLITRGELAPGKRADITFFKTETSQVAMTISQGKVIYKADS